MRLSQQAMRSSATFGVENAERLKFIRVPVLRAKQSFAGLRSQAELGNEENLAFFILHSSIFIPSTVQ
jgi:hypothetical protein